VDAGASPAVPSITAATAKSWIELFIIKPPLKGDSSLSEIRPGNQRPCWLSYSQDVHTKYPAFWRFYDSQLVLV
jgi:hypothetical protein